MTLDTYIDARADFERTQGPDVADLLVAASHGAIDAAAGRRCGSPYPADLELWSRAYRLGYYSAQLRTGQDPSAIRAGSRVVVVASGLAGVVAHHGGGALYYVTDESGATRGYWREEIRPAT